MDLNKFIYLSTLQVNPTQKTVCLLGKVKGRQEQGEAIIILTPKLPSIPVVNEQEQQKLPIFPFTELSTIFQNDIYSKFCATFPINFQIQSIFPINQKHKAKYRKTTKTLLKQTSHDYNLSRQLLLTTELSHIGWVKNIINSQAQQQRILYKNADIILLPDFKFHNLKEIQNLHLLCIFTDSGLHSIRDLNGNHLQILQRVQKMLEENIAGIFDDKITASNCRVYFHYPPTFYQLHLHVQSLQLDTKTCNTERCHELTTVIQNIKIKEDYYQNVTLNCFKEISNT